jgi:hypothetical protein
VHPKNDDKDDDDEEEEAEEEEAGADEEEDCLVRCGRLNSGLSTVKRVKSTVAAVPAMAAVVEGCKSDREIAASALDSSSPVFLVLVLLASGKVEECR